MWTWRYWGLSTHVRAVDWDSDRGRVAVGTRGAEAGSSTRQRDGASTQAARSVVATLAATLAVSFGHSMRIQRCRNSRRLVTTHAAYLVSL